ncbi:MAG TPA: hypothetical protein VLR90_01955 [Blastocatellia bacterium]|nr:hypothetical protein [Blastocatellia bacterium]
MNQMKSQDRSPEDSAESKAPGFVVERRFFVHAAPIALAALALGLPEKLSAESRERLTESASLDFDEFVKECAALAKQAIADSSLNEEAHIFRLSMAASRLALKGVPRGKLGQFVGLNPPVEFGPLHVAAPLAIIQWRLAPGATLPAHNHTPADIISLCIEGECAIRHFDIVGDAPEYSSRETFLILETRNDLLTPGRVSSLSTTRDNIHTFHAGKEGALGIDINSILPGDKKFSFLDFADKPRDSQKRIYEAVWKKI